MIQFWDLGLYLFSLGLGIFPRPLLVFVALTWFAYQVASYRIRNDNDVEVDNDVDLDPISGAEPPCEPETSSIETYKVQLLRDRYRLLSDTRYRSISAEVLNISEFDSVARALNGYEVSGSLHGVTLRRARQIAYQKHVVENTCFPLIALIVDI